jgi:hypothetical protein
VNAREQFWAENPFDAKSCRRRLLEMTTSVPAGAYVVENPDGERYAMPAEEFFTRYEVDPEPDPDR